MEEGLLKGQSKSVTPQSFLDISILGPYRFIATSEARLPREKIFR